MSNKTGILYFSLTPKLEASRKRWTQSKVVNVKIAQQLYRHTLKKIQATQIPCIEVNENKQSSKLGFGERLTKAIQTVFRQGYDHVIVIGNDCLDISKQDILLAHQQIQAGEQTVGLTRDGGTFLFSLSKGNWNKEVFTQLAWCTNQLGQELAQFLGANALVNTLEIKTDIDSFEDILYLIRHTRSVYRALLSNYLQLAFFKRGKSISIPQNVCTSILLRGPPALI